MIPSISKKIRFTLGVLTLISALTFGQTPPPGDFTTPPGSPTYAAAGPIRIDQVTAQSLNTTQSGLVFNMPADGSDSINIFLNSTSGFSQTGTPHNGPPSGQANGANGTEMFFS